MWEIDFSVFKQIYFMYVNRFLCFFFLEDISLSGYSEIRV